jgi:hypothetical protein
MRMPTETQVIGKALVATAREAMLDMARGFSSETLSAISHNNLEEQHVRSAAADVLRERAKMEAR